MISLGQYEIVPEELPDGRCILNITLLDPADYEHNGVFATIDLASLFDSRDDSERSPGKTSEIGG